MFKIIFLGYFYTNWAILLSFPSRISTFDSGGCTMLRLLGLPSKNPKAYTILAVDWLTLTVNPLQLLTNTRIALKTVFTRGARVYLCKGYTESYSLHSLLGAVGRSYKVSTRCTPCACGPGCD